MALRSYLDGSLFAEHLPGSEPPVLALHGWGRDRADLRRCVGPHEAHLVDLPGFGSSLAPEKAWGAREYSAEIARFVDEARLQPSVVVGHSFGGRVAAHLAASRPDLVRGVVFIGTPLVRRDPVRKPLVRYRAVRWATQRGLLAPDRLERLKQRHGSADYRSSSGVMRDILVTVVNEDYSDQLRAIACPVGFVWGARDTQVPLEVAHEGAALVAACAGVTIVEAAGHDVHLTHPAAVSDMVETTLAAAQ